MKKEILEFYKNQGERTKVEKNPFKEIPRDIKEITKIIRGWGIHPVEIFKQNLKFSKYRINDRSLKTVQEVMNKIKKLDNRNLNKTRKTKDKIVIICKHFAMLLTSILRSKGIPARCRCGFATYFSRAWFEDHWICEYWNGKKWLRVDPQMGRIKEDKKHLTSIDFNNLPKDIFFPAGVLWQLYRKGFISGNYCGFSHERGENGSWYIRGNMLRDFFALNKTEYTYQETNKLMDKNYSPNKKDLKLLDEIAKITTNPDKNFRKIRSLYKKRNDLKPNKK